MTLSDRVAGRRHLHRTQRGWQPPITGRSYLVEAIIAAAYIALLYKVVAVGLAALVILTLTFPFIRFRDWKISWPAAATSLAYVAMCTVTALFVNKLDGAERIVQGMIAVGSTAALAKYVLQFTVEERAKFFKAFTVLNLIILANVIIWHVTHGHTVTWKYLRDTKFVFATIVVLLFYWEDEIKARSIMLWTLLLPGCGLIVLVSGERKAYLTFAACYLLSRARWTTIVTFGTAGLAAAALYAVAAPNSYVTRQMESFFVDANTDELPTRYFFSVSSLSDQSDLVRTFVNRNARMLFRKHLLWGMGSTGYQHWAEQTYGPISNSNTLSMNVHGERNRVPVEGGLLGIAIALSFLSLSALRFGLYWRANGGAQAPSRIRGPAYLYALMFFYIYSEALDTTMLLLILVVGFTAGTLHFAPNRGSLRGGRARLGALRNQGRMVDGRRPGARGIAFGLLRPAR